MHTLGPVNERETKRRMRENLWVHTLGSLNEREEKKRNAREPQSAHVRSF